MDIRFCLFQVFLSCWHLLKQYKNFDTGHPLPCVFLMLRMLRYLESYRYWIKLTSTKKISVIGTFILYLLFTFFSVLFLSLHANHYLAMKGCRLITGGRLLRKGGFCFVFQI